MRTSSTLIHLLRGVLTQARRAAGGRDAHPGRDDEDREDSEPPWLPGLGGPDRGFNGPGRTLASVPSGEAGRRILARGANQAPKGPSPIRQRLRPRPKR